MMDKINKFVNKNKARVGNTPGFTRGKQWIKIDEKLENGKNFRKMSNNQKEKCENIY